MSLKDYINNEKSNSYINTIKAVSNGTSVSSGSRLKDYFNNSDEYRAKDVQGVSDKVKMAYNAYNAMYTNYNNRYGSENSNDITWKEDYADYYNRAGADRKVLIGHVNDAINELKANKNLFDDEYYKSTLDTLEKFKSYSSYFVDRAGYENDAFSQFNSEYDFNGAKVGWLKSDADVNGEMVAGRKEFYESNKKRISEIDMLLYDGTLSKEEKNALKKERDDLIADNTEYERTQAVVDNYYSVEQQDNFETDSQYRNYTNATKEEMKEWDNIANHWYDNNAYKVAYYDSDGNPRDAQGNIVDVLGTTMPSSPVVEDKLGLYLSASDEDITQAYTMVNASNGNYQNMSWESALIDGYNKRWHLLEDNEIGIYYSIYKNQGQEAAYKFLDDMEIELGRREQEQYQKEIDGSNALEKLAYNIASIPTSVVGGAIGFVDDAIGSLTGNYNPYSAAHRGQFFTEAVRGSTANDINNAFGNLSIPYVNFTFGDAYQSLMSGADSVLGATLFGEGYTILMGLGAASTEARKLFDSGATRGQILLGSVLAGTAEALFEKISLDHFLDIDSTTSKIELIKQVLAQAGVEASEETFTEMANTLTNAIVMGTQSDWASYRDKYIAQGYSEAQATALALFNDVAPNVINAALGGFISGGAMGYIGSKSNLIKYNKYVKQTNTSRGETIVGNKGTDKLLEQANKYKSDKTVSKLLSKLSGVDYNSLSKNEQRTYNANLGDLATIISSKVQDDAGIASGGLNEKNSTLRTFITAKTKLAEKGTYKGDIKQAAQIVTKAYAGEKLTAGEKKIFNQIGGVNFLNEIGATSQKDYQNIAYKNAIDSLTNVINVEDAFSPKEDGKYTRSTSYAEDIEKKVSESSKTINISTGEEVDIRKVTNVGVKDGNVTMTFELSNGKEVDSSNIKYANSGMAILYEGFARMGMKADDINLFVESSKSSTLSNKDYQKAVEEVYELGYTYGYNGNDTIDYETFSKDETLSKKLDIAGSTSVDKKLAYESGLNAAVDSFIERTNKTVTLSKANESGVVLPKGVNFAKLSERQKASIIAINEIVSKVTHNKVVFYETKLNKDGVLVMKETVGDREQGQKAPNGMYLTGKDGTIYIDINAGNNAEQIIMMTFAHELTHFIAEWNNKGLRQLGNFLANAYSKNGESFESLVRERMAQENLTYQDAMEETIADSMMDMFNDGDLLEKLVGLKRTNNTLFGKLKQGVDNIYQRLKDAYNGVYSQNKANAIFRDKKVISIEQAEKVKSIFAQALKDAGENYSKANVNKSTNQGETKLSERDNQYLELAKNPKANETKLREMVEEEARKNGYTKEGWHGSNAKFNSFSYDLRGTSSNGFGTKSAFFVARDYKHAEYWAENASRTNGGDKVLYHVYVDTGNSYTFDFDKLKDGVSDENGYKYWDVAKQLLSYDDYYDSVIFKNAIDDETDEKRTFYAVKYDTQIKSADLVTYDDSGKVIPLSQRFDNTNNDIRYSERQYAPVFYSVMEQEIKNMKQDKIGVDSLINYLKGKGVKNEEIYWSGIETFLNGKKSVSKQDLIEYLVGSSLKIEEESLTNSGKTITEAFTEFTEEVESAGMTFGFVDSYMDDNYSDLFYHSSFEEDVKEMLEYGEITQDQYDKLIAAGNKFDEALGSDKFGTKWHDHKLEGGKNYQELLFKLPNNSYTNRAMDTHWGKSGVLAHARMQDFTTVDGKNMLFVEEIQSDWHNEGNKNGYRNVGEKTSADYSGERGKLYNEFFKWADNTLGYRLNLIGYSDIGAASVYANIFEDTNGETINFLKKAFQKNGLEFTEKELSAIQEYIQKGEKLLKLAKTSPKRDSAINAPFKDTYQDYVMKRLLRMAAEQGYDSIGWTTAKIQDERWNDANTDNVEKRGVSGNLEGYRIEYDQDIPKFLNKYGKKFGGAVSKSLVKTKKYNVDTLNKYSVSKSQRVWSLWNENGEFVDSIVQDQNNYPSNETDAMLEFKKMAQGESIWSFDITESMKESVLYKGQAKYSDRILMGSEFSGGGMLEAGLIYQMLDKEFAVEWDENIAAVYRDNWGDHIYAGKEDGDVLKFDISKHKDDLFYFHASPVCHNFSKAKHGRVENPLDIESAKKVAKDLEIAKPQVFTVENAPEYLKSKSLKIITDKLHDLGYKFDPKVYNAADYGSATSRERCILIATRDVGLPSEPQKIERTNSWDKVTRHLWDGLKVSKARNGNALPDYLLDAFRNTKKLKDIFNKDGTITIDKPLLVITTTNAHEVTYAWEGKLCPTLTTKCGDGRLILAGENISLVKPNKNVRRVSPEFMGAIQGLPSDYNYGKAETRAFTIIGNGIPTHLTKAVIGGVLDYAYEKTHDGKVLYSERDQQYLELAKDSKANETELRKMVEQAAKENGYNSPMLYHGTKSKFTTFDFEKAQWGAMGYGLYFASDYDIAKQFGESNNKSSIISAYSSANNLLDDNKPSHTITAEQVKRFMAENNISFENTIGMYTNTTEEWVSKHNDFDIVYSLQSWLHYKKNLPSQSIKPMLNSLMEMSGFNGIVRNRGNGREYVIWDNSLVKSADLVTYDDDGNIIPLSERFNKNNNDIRYSERSNEIIKSAISQNDMKMVLERAFNAGVKQYTDYKSVNEWLANDDTREVCLIVESYEDVYEYLTSKINKEFLNQSDYGVEDLIDAYKNNELVGYAKESKTKRLDLSIGDKVNDNRFYSPTKQRDVSKLLQVANQRANSSNGEEVYKARAEVILALQNKNAMNAMGMTEKDVNALTKKWSRYSSSAKNISQRINNNVADAYKWTGIENTALINSYKISDDEFKGMVKDVIGNPSSLSKAYIAQTMLAIDTHTDWSWLTFDFGSEKEVNEKYSGNHRAVLGYYQSSSQSIVTTTSLNTVAHEMGHALDNKYANDIFRYINWSDAELSKVDADYVERQVKDKDAKQFALNFVNFIDNICDSADTSSSYRQQRNETFARFVAKFVEWANNLGVMNSWGRSESSYYGDKFTTSQFIEFAKLLQEKSKLDSQKMSEQAKYSNRDNGYTETEYTKQDNKALTEIRNNYVEDSKTFFNLKAVDKHIEAFNNFEFKDSKVTKEVLLDRYNKYVEWWQTISDKLNSEFLTNWNNKPKNERIFKFFKDQMGYKYNGELSTMCAKGVPLFEAIDEIVKKKVIDELDTQYLGKREKSILYKMLSNRGFAIPCAICYVEQARQREGTIINAFLNGKIETNSSGVVQAHKYGWNEILTNVEKKMAELGVEYKFAEWDRSIATDNYTAKDVEFTEEQANAFYEALRQVSNEMIAEYNELPTTKPNQKKSLIPKSSGVKLLESVNKTFKGNVGSNFRILKELFTNTDTRYKLDKDLLYSSLTTKNISKFHSNFYSIFNSQGGVSGYKTKQGTIAYYGDLLAATGKKWSSDKLKLAGGLRNQSNSDFQMYTFLDQMQFYADATARGYYIHAYTKVLSELKLFGLSGAKINASLIPMVEIRRNEDGSINVEETKKYAGLDKDGNPIYDDVEGVNHEEAFMLIGDKNYSKNITGICIGYSVEHIKKLLNEDKVQEIIGFHDKTDDGTKRFLKARYAENFNGRNETYGFDKKGKWGVMHLNFYDFVTKAEKMLSKGNIERMHNGQLITFTWDDVPMLAADLYLEECKNKGYDPMYNIDGIVNHDNYYKLLADYGMKDSEGHYAPHQKVELNIPSTVPYLEDGKVKHMNTQDYIAKELKAEMDTRDAISNVLAEQGEDSFINEFVKNVNDKTIDENGNKIGEKVFKSERNEEYATINKMQKELDDLKTSYAELKELLNIQGKLSDGKFIERKSVEKVAKKIGKEYGIKDTSQLASMLEYAYGKIIVDPSMSWEQAFKILDKAAQYLYNNYEDPKPILTEDAKDFLKAVRETNVSLTETQLQEAGYRSGNLAQFRRENFGTLKIVKGGTTLEQVYSEWLNEFGQFFDTDDDNEGNMIPNLLKAIENAKKSFEEQYGWKDVPKDAFFSETKSKLYEGIFDVDEVVTAADKANVKFVATKEKVKQANAEIKDLRQKLRTATETKDYWETRVQQVKDQYANQKLKAQETIIRNDIKKIHGKLNSLIMNSTDKAFIPTNLINATLDVLEAIDIRNGKTNATQEKLNELYVQYNALKENSDYDYSSEYDKFWADQILLLKDMLKGRNIYAKDRYGNYAFSVNELEYIYNVAKGIYDSISDARKIILGGDVENTVELGKEVVGSQSTIARKYKNESKVVKGIRLFDKNTSIYFLNTLRLAYEMSDYNDTGVLYRLFNDINEGVKKGYMWQMKVTKDLDALVKGENKQKYLDAQSKIMKFGQYEMTAMEAMQLLLTIEREKTTKTNHLGVGGARIFNQRYIDDFEKAKTKGYVLHSTIGDDSLEIALRDGLKDEWYQQYMDVARQIFNVDSKNAINEVSLILKHRKIAFGNNYIPFVTDKNFNVKEFDGLMQDAAIDKARATKQLVAGANNPLLIYGLDKVLAKNIDFVTKYYGTAIPISNAKKVLNYKNSYEGVSVAQSIQHNFGEKAFKILTQSFQDISVGRAYDSSKILNTLKSIFVTTTLSGNISVSIKQAASLYTAFAVLDPSLQVGAWTEFVKTVKNYESITNEIDKYTAEHWRRRIGLSTDEIAAMTKATGFVHKMDMKLPTILNGNKWIQMIDCWTTATFWNLAKKDVQKNYKDIEVGSEDYWAKVTQLYEKAVEETQPMYDTLHRSEMQKNNAINSVLMFKTQPLQNAGLVFTGTREFINAIESQDETKIKESRKKLTAILGSQFASALTFALMTAVASALKGKMKRYKKDDELTFWSFIQTLGVDIGSGLSNIVFPILLPELYNALEKKFYENSSYGDEILTVPLMEFINDYYTKVSRLIESPTLSNIESVVLELIRLLGIPAQNYNAMLKGIRYNIEDIVNGNFGQFKASESKNVSEAEKIYDAIVKGDTDKQNELYNDLVESKKESIQANRIKSGKAEYSDEELTSEAQKSALTSVSNIFKSKYLEAYKVADESTMNYIKQLMVQSGLFGGEYAVQNKLNTWSEGYLQNGQEVENPQDPQKVYDLIMNGDTSTATSEFNNQVELSMQEIIGERDANGEEELSESELKEKATSRVKNRILQLFKSAYLDAYNNNDKDAMTSIRKKMANSKLFGSASDIVAKCQGWIKNSK